MTRQQIKEKLNKELNAIGSNMIRDIQAQQKRARQLMYQAETRKRIKPPPSRRQLNRKAKMQGPVFRGYNGLLGEHLVQKHNDAKPHRPKVVSKVNRVYNALLNKHLDNKQGREEVLRRIMDIQKRQTMKSKNSKTSKKYIV